MGKHAQTPSDNELVGLACRFGTLGAIGFKHFADTLDGVPEDGRRYLLRCFAATCDLGAGDAGKEIGLLRDALCKLRDEWKDAT